MNDIDIHEVEEVSIRTGLKAGDGQMVGSGGYLGSGGGNTAGDEDPGRGVIGSGT